MEISRLKGELSRVKMERDILKKSDGVFCEGVVVRYAFIERHRNVWPVVVQCRGLEVSVSGYRQHRARGAKPPAAAPEGKRLGDMALLADIRAVFHEMNGA